MKLQSTIAQYHSSFQFLNHRNRNLMHPWFKQWFCKPEPDGDHHETEELLRQEEMDSGKDPIQLKEL